MSVLSAALVTGAVVILAVVAGLLWRARTGRVVTVGGTTPRRDPRAGATGSEDAGTGVGIDDGELSRLLGFAASSGESRAGSLATLVQFSSDHCAACGPTRRILGEVATDHEGVRHVEIDLTPHPELANRWNILQTPTTLLFDGAGRVRGRIGGAPRIPDLLTALTPILEADHAHH